MDRKIECFLRQIWPPSYRALFDRICVSNDPAHPSARVCPSFSLYYIRPIDESEDFLGLAVYLFHIICPHFIGLKRFYKHEPII